MEEGITRRHNVSGDIEVHNKVNFYYPFIDHVIHHLNDRFPEEIKGVLLAISFLIPAKLHLLDEAVVAKLNDISKSVSKQIIDKTVSVILYII